MMKQPPRWWRMAVKSVPTSFLHRLTSMKKYGGVVPEVASRIHVENISVVIEEALVQAEVTMDDILAIAVTQGPGLVGSLHVGVQAAKTLAWYYDKPLIPLHHIIGHIYANRFVDELRFPMIALVVSGGQYRAGLDEG